MKLGWKRVAQRADNHNYAADEIATAILPALADDCRDEMSTEYIDSIRNLFEQQESLLFKDDVRAQLDALRDKAGHGIGRTFLDNVIQISASDAPELLSLIEAMTAALADRAHRCSRQTEEHYYRKSSSPRATNVRARFDQGIAGAALQALARQVLKLEGQSTARPKLKRQDLDDGVPLR
jgi:hypothetical protein